jgi:hypothetical protein
MAFNNYLNIALMPFYESDPAVVVSVDSDYGSVIKPLHRMAELKIISGIAAAETDEANARLLEAIASNAAIRVCRAIKTDELDLIDHDIVKVYAFRKVMVFTDAVRRKRKKVSFSFMRTLGTDILNAKEQITALNEYLGFTAIRDFF